DLKSYPDTIGKWQHASELERTAEYDESRCLRGFAERDAMADADECDRQCARAGGDCGFDRAGSDAAILSNPFTLIRQGEVKKGEVDGSSAAALLPSLFTH